MQKEIKAKFVVKNPSDGVIVTTTFWPIAEIELNIGKQTYDVTMVFRDPWTCEPLSSDRVNFLNLPTGCNYAWMIAKTLQAAHPEWTFTWDYDNLSGQITIETDKDSHNDVITTHKENKTMRFTKVIVNGPATIAWVTTGRNPAKKVAIKKADGDIYDLEKAMLLCWAKSWFSDDTDFHKWFKLNMKMFKEAYDKDRPDVGELPAVDAMVISANINATLERMSKKLREYKEKINSTYGKASVGDNIVNKKEKKGAVWSWDEVSFLNRHYSTKSVKHIAMVLGRSEAAVRAKARKLGIKRGGDTNDA